MVSRNTSSRPAVYVAYRQEPTPGAVFGTFVSCPGDVHQDARRLYGEGAEWVSKSRCPAWLKRKAKLADAGGRPVPWLTIN